MRTFHNQVQQVLDYPDTTGKQIALLHYRWQESDEYTRIVVSTALLRLAKIIDEVLPKPYSTRPTCALLTSKEAHANRVN